MVVTFSIGGSGTPLPLVWPDANSLHYEEITDDKPRVFKTKRMAKGQPARNIDEPKLLKGIEATPRQWEAALNVHDTVALANLYDVTTDDTRRR